MYSLKYPVAFHPVDMAITRIHEGRVQVLLAQKVKDSEGGKNVWRFPGGFVDPWDSCAEEAALRESIEETSMKFGSELVREAFDEYFKKKKPFTDRITKLIESESISSPAAWKDAQIKIKENIAKLNDIQLSDVGLMWLRKNVTYIGSTKIDDARYRDTDHKVITSFYELHPTLDAAGEGPFDDIARTKWFFLSEIKDEIMHPSHKPLFAMLFDKYEAEKIVDEVFENAEKMAKNVEEMFESFKKDTEEMFDGIKKKIPEFEKKASETMKNVEKKMEKLFDIFK